MSQHCKTPAQLPGLPDVNILDISLNFDWDNLSDDVRDFLLAAAEHTKAPPVGLHDSETILGYWGSVETSHIVFLFSVS